MNIFERQASRAFRIAVRRGIRKNWFPLDKVDAIQKMLADDEQCCFASIEAYSKYDPRIVNNDLLFGAGERDWMAFIQWILDHSDEIIAMVMKIIALFSEE